MKHKVTVVMTSYNIEQYLPRFFFCMHRQTFTDYCLLVVDDGSTDNSVKVIKEYAEKDERITLVESEHLGISGIRDLAMSKISTPLVSFVDGDDVIGPQYLEHLVNAMEKYCADLVISRVEYLRENGHPFNIQTPYNERYIEKSQFQSALPPLLRDRRLNYLYAKLFRSSLLEGIRLQDSSVSHGEDTMIVFQYLTRIKSIVLIDDADYHYIKYTSRSITSYKGDEAYDRLLKINLFLLDFTKEHDMLTDDMLHIIDGRILVSGNWTINGIMDSDLSKREKIRQLATVLENPYYERSFERQRENLSILRFDYIEPQRAKDFYARKMREKQIQNAKRIIINNSPLGLRKLISKRPRGKTKTDA